MEQCDFQAERVSKTATITLEENMDRVFPLFGPVEEKKWAEGWNPEILYPASAQIGEGMVFTTQGHGHGEDTFAWIVSKYQPENHLIEYTVSTPNRYWTINIQCQPLSDGQTKATISYTYTGLTALGNQINRHAIEKMYEKNLKDWEDAINHYLKTGQALKHQ